MLLSLSLGLLAASSPAQLPQPSAIDELQLEFVLTAEGPRYYRTFVPAGAGPLDELPMIVCYHGGFGNALQIAGSNGVLEEARRRGWMAVFPEGTSLLDDGKGVGLPPFKLQVWNAGTCCGSAAEENIDDVGFFERMLSKLDAQHPLDEDRVFVTGMSNGAMMSYRIASERPDLVAGIAPVAGSRSVDAPVLPVPILAIHGLLDENVPFQGGVGSGFSGVDHLSQAEAFLPFLAVGGLGGPAQVSTGPNYLYLQWAGKPTGAPSAYFLATDGGHTWPGTSGSPINPFEPVHNDVPATALMFAFFAGL